MHAVGCDPPSSFRVPPGFLSHRNSGNTLLFQTVRSSGPAAAIQKSIIPYRELLLQVPHRRLQGVARAALCVQPKTQLRHLRTQRYKTRRATRDREHELELAKASTNHSGESVRRASWLAHVICKASSTPLRRCRITAVSVLAVLSRPSASLACILVAVAAQTSSRAGFPEPVAPAVVPAVAAGPGSGSAMPDALSSSSSHASVPHAAHCGRWARVASASRVATYRRRCHGEGVTMRGTRLKASSSCSVERPESKRG